VKFCTPFAAIHLIEELNLTGSGFEVSYLPPIMNRFVMLRILTLQFMSVNTILLCCMLTLPNLQYLVLENCFYDEPIHGIDMTKNILFQPSNYPADTSVLSPLKEFTWKSHRTIFFTEEIILTFLQRFPSLELYAVEHVAMNAEEFKQLQREYRYRTIITDNFVN